MGIAGLLALPTGACSARAQTGDPLPEDGLELVRVARGLSDPVYLTAPSGDDRLFVVEQAGRIRIVEDGRILSEPILDITDRVRSGGERGLLSMAFHPRYASNGFLYVNYTDRRGDTRVERYRVGRDPSRADPGSGSLVLRVEQPYANHNGGHILFGPDGMLYVGMGDGGSGGDPHGHGQNPATLLGALLRLDVDRGNPYAIPPDNPYAGERGRRGEIWAIGLRNPWRFAFDPPEGLLYIADVGQNRWEEINVTDLRRPGLNYGWNRMEGNHPYKGGASVTEGLIRPVAEYGRSGGCSVTGGFVYRGRSMPALAGTYFYSDYCAGWVRSFRWRDGRVTEHRQWRLPDLGPVLSFGLDGAGELYLLTGRGEVHRFRQRAGGPG